MPLLVRWRHEHAVPWTRHTILSWQTHETTWTLKKVCGLQRRSCWEVTVILQHKVQQTYWWSALAKKYDNLMIPSNCPRSNIMVSIKKIQTAHHKRSWQWIRIENNEYISSPKIKYTKDDDSNNNPADINTIGVGQR